MGPHEIEMKRQIKEGWIPNAEYRVFQGGTFARDYCAEIAAERDQLRAEVERLRGALELLLKCNALGVAIPWGRAVSALALTAEAEKEAANG